MAALRDRGRLGRWLHGRLLPLQHTSERRLHDLRFLFLEVTQRCNLDCRHCGSDCTASADHPDLPADKILEVLSGIRDRYDASRITVGLSGGEPLLYPDVFELGREITRLGFPWGMVTNGWAWTPEAVRAADAAGMGTITVSLDGLRADHDWLRGRAGSFERATRALRLLAAAEWVQALDVVTCVNRRNLRQLDGIRDHLAELGVAAWRLFTISPIGRAANEPELHLSRDEFRRLMRWIEGSRGGAGLAVSYSESGYLGSCDTVVRDGPFFCRAGIRVAGIMVDGAILACPNIDRSFAQGNVFSDDFCRVWETRYAPFRDRTWMRQGECVDCGEWALCQGNSFHLWDPATDRPRVCYVRDYGLDEPL